MADPNQYRLTLRMEQDNMHRWVRDLLREHTRPGATTHTATWPDLELQLWYEPSPPELFRHGRTAGECGVRYNIAARDLPHEIYSFLPRVDQMSSHDVYFVPTDPNGITIKRRGREVRAIIVTRSKVIVARLGCSHPDFLVEQVTPTYSVHQCVGCGMTYDRDTGD